MTIRAVIQRWKYNSEIIFMYRCGLTVEILVTTYIIDNRKVSTEILSNNLFPNETK